MATQKRCDLSHMAIPDGTFDAGAGPLICRAPGPDGETVEVHIEVQPRADGSRWMIRPVILQRLIANTELQEVVDPDPGVIPLKDPKEQRTAH